MNLLRWLIDPSVRYEVESRYDVYTKSNQRAQTQSTFISGTINKAPVSEGWWTWRKAHTIGILKGSLHQGTQRDLEIPVTWSPPDEEIEGWRHYDQVNRYVSHYYDGFRLCVQLSCASLFYGMCSGFADTTPPSDTTLTIGLGGSAAAVFFESQNRTSWATFAALIAFPTLTYCAGYWLGRQIQVLSPSGS